jgi:DNA helicase II / ATP-dependent DNA helicase PcrA
MINPTEQEEREYLEIIKEKLLNSIQHSQDRVRQVSAELQQSKQYLHEHKSGMDEADLVASEQSITRMAFSGDSAVAHRRKLMKLIASPYFGRIDFLESGRGDEPNAIYIGIYTFADEVLRKNVIYDWRAPVSSMFYDFELGDGWYSTPGGKISGTISLKRQYRIKDGRMEFMIENAVNIHDEVLQRELSKSADDKMKNIVATIQRDQNAVIRNESAKVMIIQGVAGSGKTSIALHRIAFLLYRFREDIRAKDILIISPNKVFADYISNVLPELGEEYIPEMGIEELAAELLENQFPFQTFFEQVSSLIDNPDDAFIERIRFKSSFEFLSKLNQHLIHIENNYFDFTELRVGKVVVPFPFIQERFRAYHRIPLLKRFPEVIKDVQKYVTNEVRRRLTGLEKTKIWEAIPRMFRMSGLLELYRDFYKRAGREDLFKMTNGKLEYSDVFPLIYFKIRLEGFQSRDHVKHLLIDEMQDYTPVQYSVLSRMFLCKKTILGDVSQRVNPYSASSGEDIERVFPQGELVKLNRSYRSTFEITMFAQQLSNNPDLIPMERHGEVPQVKRLETEADEMQAVKELVAVFKKSGHRSLGIICKTEKQANLVCHHVKSKDVHLISSESTSFYQGIVIATSHLAKGLEFDEVIIPFASSQNYATDVEKSMLYIACTRAMHKLTLTCTGGVTKFLS